MPPSRSIQPRRSKRPRLGDPAALTLFAAPHPDLSEREWQYVIQGALDAEAYRWNHVYRMPTPHGGWATPTTSPGWPDIVAIRAPFILAIEAKGKRTPFKPGQPEWLATFAELPFGRAWVIRPQDDWHMIAEWLRDPENAPRTYGWDTVSAEGQQRGA